MTKAKEMKETDAAQTQQQAIPQSQSATSQTQPGASRSATTLGQPRQPDSSALARGRENPFTLMHRFADEMNRMFERFGMGRNFMPGLFAPQQFGQTALQSWWSPQIEMFERNGQLCLRADLPGLNKEDVQIEINENQLVIQGERRDEQEDNRAGYYRSERSYGSFYRSIPLPEGVESDKAEAKFDNGVLEISMPAPQRQTRSRQIEIR